MIVAFVLWAGMAWLAQGGVTVRELIFPENVVSGGVVVAEAEVSKTSVDALRITHGEEPFSRIVSESLKHWTFPDVAEKAVVPIVVTFRTPFVMAVGSPQYQIPAPAEQVYGPFPETIYEPAYPMNMMNVAGNVVLALTINGKGKVLDSEVVQELPGATEACRDAVLGWKFRPVRTDSPEKTATAFAVCVFRWPVLSSAM